MVKPKTQPPQSPVKRKLQTWLEKRSVLAACGVLAFVLAYVFVRWAMDSGSLFDYSIAILLVLVGLRDLYVAVRGPRVTGEKPGGGK